MTSKVSKLKNKALRLKKLSPTAKRFLSKNITTFKITLSAGLIPMLSTSCGTDSNSSIISSYPTEKPVSTTIFAYSGNNSCKEGKDGYDTPLAADIYIALQKFLKSVEYEFKDPEIDFVVSCYNFGSEYISYTTSWDQNVVYQTDEQEVRDLTLEQMDSKPDDKFIILGHSYGGWLAMDSIKDFQGSQEVEQLVTLDPISKKLCSWSTPSGCLQAPLDIVKGMRQNIRLSSTNWSNFYQTESMFIHSSAIPEAHANQRKVMSHTEIDNSPEVWQDVGDLLRPILTRIETLH